MIFFTIFLCVVLTVVWFVLTVILGAVIHSNVRIIWFILLAFAWLSYTAGCLSLIYYATGGN